MDGTELCITGSHDPADTRELEAFLTNDPELRSHTRCCRGKEITLSADRIGNLTAEQPRGQVADLAAQPHCHLGER